MGGVGALRGALAHESGLLQARERQIEKTVGAVVLVEALTEVGQHAVVEAGIVQLQGHGVLEIDAAADRFRCLPVRQAEQSHEYQPAKSSSHHSPSSRSLTHIAVVPPGLLARAICAVRDGTCSPERGRSDNRHLDNCIGLRNSPEHAR
ncbi:hypothetical protein GCM10010211_85920 [Streptomyces albospinus]|uniref:Uncharacterized protein n=1 Tax=Streptomyces albospinus TaxID=285515 RepID=A0ABQ2VRY8_9ACTN|nr:hypothetical protein GCM10010211_85920 [Streptomyces albospinus]